MAEVMSLYRRTQQRLDPHWERLTNMLNDDPTFESSVATAEHQRLFRQVTEVMHFMSHAQHAISDIMLDLGTAPPRQLRGRPFVIQSAVVQSAHAIIHRNASPGPERRAASASRASARQQPPAAAATAGAEP